MDTKPSKENGSDKPSSQSAGSIAQRSRLRRTLLFAGVFALLAMIFVPGESDWYRFVAFAALAGAILANLSKRALYVIGGCIALVAFGVGVFALKRGMEDAAYRADSDERYANRLLLLKEEQYGQMDRVEVANAHLRSAAHKWRLAMRFGEAKRAEERADEVAKMSAADRSRINQGATPVVTPTPTPGLGTFNSFADLIPEPPEPWDTESVSVVWSEAHEIFSIDNRESRRAGFSLEYALQNNTDRDITIPENVTIMKRLTKGGVLVNYSNVARVNAATFLPAHRRAQLSIAIRWGCDVQDPSGKTLQKEDAEACFARCFADSDGLTTGDDAPPRDFPDALHNSVPFPALPPTFDRQHAARPRRLWCRFSLNIRNAGPREVDGSF